ncbi:MAG: M48 family metallopeptidase [Aestuariivita sp.]|nr:M48 family metallopeptidase [Aestuariivita sp.]
MPPDFSVGKNKPLKKIDTKQMIYLYSVMKAIEEVSETRAELFIVNGDSANAFASTRYVKLIPSKEQIITTRRDGSARIRANSEFTITYDEQSYHAENDQIIVNVVGINFAMLDFLGSDVHMAAALIGHELAHIKLEHGKNRAKKDTATFSVEATRYLRDHEREADYLGAVWAVEAGYDPQGAVRLEELLMEKNKKRRSGYSLTHPSSRERLIKIKSLARRLAR